jgi:hypothetical protein
MLVWKMSFGSWISGVTPRRSQRIVGRRSRWLIAAALVAVCAGPARADELAQLSRTLATGKVEKERISAAVQLGKLRDGRALRPLIGALGDRSNVVRAVAAGALGFLGDPAALPALRRASTDPDKTVRRRAVEAIAQLRQGNVAGARSASRNAPLANYAIAGRESPRLSAEPSLFVVMKSTTDKSAGRIDPGTRKVRAGQLKSLLLKELEANRQVTLESNTAEELGIEPYALDVTITRLGRAESGPFIEIECELRVAISNRRGKMISFLTGGAKVQVPKRTFRSAYEPALRMEAMENAVKSVHQDLITYLNKRPS